VYLSNGHIVDIGHFSVWIAHDM